MSFRSKKSVTVLVAKLAVLLTAANAYAQDSDIRLAYFTQTLNPWTQAHISGIEEVINAKKGALQTFNSQFNVQTQNQQCQDAIASGRFNGFIIYPNSGPAIVSCAKSAVAAGIKVVALGTPIGPSNMTLDPQVDGITGSVFYEGGAEAQSVVDLLKKACGDKECSVGYFAGLRTSTYDSVKLSEVKKRIEGTKIEIVSVLDGGYQPETGRAAARDLLQSHPDVQVIVSAAEEASRGIFLALQAANKLDQVKIISSGTSAFGWQQTKDGIFFGDVIYLPRTAARRAAEIMVGALEGKPLEINQVNEADLSLIGAILTKENADQFTPEWGSVQ